ncbi:hypothetical protein GRF29_69g1062981 [Pseudopithomyces chartarum]|uniref:Mid2 domain-containing protein n=1 Tax=Pseudopithomyces chartarum TaxID=1892770 RepID=A0AAN6RHS0_9PLEO|nr:hypothetical protein GRF29_69g1062981 [Pseudopithomyces chartarum]
MKHYLIAALWATFFAAVVPTTPTATATAPAVLHKREITTVGFFSAGSQDGSTLWGTVTYETEGAMVGTSGSQFALCASNSCAFGSCSAGTYIMSTTVIPCGPASSSTCGSNLLYTDVFDTAPLTNFFCDQATETGFTLYKKTPVPVSILTPVSTTEKPPKSAPAKNPTPIGAIVGGTIGGIAVIGALVVAAILLIRRRGNTPSDQVVKTAPPPQESKPYVGMAIAPQAEKSPQSTANSYPVEVAGSSLPPQIPAPRYSWNNGGLNELPTQRLYQ